MEKLLITLSLYFHIIYITKEVPPLIRVDLGVMAPLWLRKGNLKRETESLLIVAQNNAVRIKASIDKTQQNSRCSLCGDRNETINHMISECSKLAQKEYKIGQGDSLGIVQEFEVLPYDQVVMLIPESVLETYKRFT